MGVGGGSGGGAEFLFDGCKVPRVAFLEKGFANVEVSYRCRGMFWCCMCIN